MTRKIYIFKNIYILRHLHLIFYEFFFEKFHSQRPQSETITTPQIAILDRRSHPKVSTCLNVRVWRCFPCDRLQ